jgi:hypothetical protein
MRIRSDFIDYYDHWFEDHGSGGAYLNRRMSDGPTRREMFKLFEERDIHCPTHGRVDYLFLDFPEVVVYTNEFAHVGEGKLLLSKYDLEEIIMNKTLDAEPCEWDGEFLQRCFGSAFIGDGGYSKRHLYIGYESFVLSYNNADDWRSNVGDNIEIRLLNESAMPRAFEYPLYAIDFVDGLAVDLNVSLGLKNTPIEEELEAKEVVELITEYYQSRRR